MEDFIFYSILLYIFMYLIFRFMKAFNDAKEEQINEKIKQIEQYVHIVKVEKHGEFYFWYDETTNDFLAQGKNEEEIIKVLRERFPRHHFIFMNDDDMITSRICAPMWQRESINI